MKIVLATPIYPPEIGGPAQYVKNLTEKLKKRGIEMEVISYNNLKKYPQPLRLFFYFFNLLKKAKNNQIIYVFNLVSCGLPTCMTSKVLRKKFIIRLGGDFLWERAVEGGRTKKPLREYYQEPKTLKEKFWMFLIKKILNSADKIIFTSNFQKEIYKKHFNVQEEKTVVILNPFPEINSLTYNLKPKTYNLLYAGRLIKLKNLDKLIEVFAKIVNLAEKPLALKIIGEGPELNNLKLKIVNLKFENKIIFEPTIPHQELLKEIQKSYLCLLPSLTEISPNFALECIKLRKPILLTKETGIYDDLKNYVIFIDPQNPSDLEKKILYLLDEKNYQDYIERIKKIPTYYSWSDVIEKHISIFKEFAAFE